MRPLPHRKAPIRAKLFQGCCKFQHRQDSEPGYLGLLLRLPPSDSQEPDIAFTESEELEEESAFVLPPGEPSPLGEVIISFPQTIRQAQERNGQVEQELALLIVHGVLHLVGYDHMEPEDEAQMQAKERAALAAVSQLEAGI